MPRRWEYAAEVPEVPLVFKHCLLLKTGPRVAKDDLELVMVLPLPSKSWGRRHALSLQS